jgi:hypothetical protein
MVMQETGHFDSQAPHEIQRESSNRGFFQSACASFATGLPLSSFAAFAGQTRPQAPHSMQRLGSMRCGELRSPAMAATGQTFVQAVQPIQAVVMLNAMCILRFAYRLHRACFAMKPSCAL